MSGQPAPVTDRLWTARDVAAYLGISVRSVQGLRIELGARLIVGKLRFRPEDVRAYEDRQQIRPAGPTSLPVEREKRRPSLKHTSAVNPLDREAW